MIGEDTRVRIACFFDAVQMGDPDIVSAAYAEVLSRLEGEDRRAFKRACYIFLYGGSNEDRADNLPWLV